MNKTLLQTIGTSIITFFILGFCFLNYTPSGITPLGGGDGMFGATVTTIQGSDKLKDSRAVINTNFANLNSDKLEISDFLATTTLTQVTSLPNLDTVGTLTTGTWNADVLTVTYGGTGTTSLDSNEVLIGNGTGYIKSINNGSNDQVLTIVAGVPAWSSVAVNETLDYDWTGAHSWTTGTTTFNSVATFNASTTWNILPEYTSDPIGDNEATRKYYVDNRTSLLSDPTQTQITNTTATTTIATVTVPGGILSTDNLIRVKARILRIRQDGGGSANFTVSFLYGSTVITSIVNTLNASQDYNPGYDAGYIEFDLVANDSTSAQVGYAKIEAREAYNDYTVAGAVWDDRARGTATEDSTADKTLSVVGKWSAASANYDLTFDSVTIQVIANK